MREQVKNSIRLGVVVGFLCGSVFTFLMGQL